MLAIHNKRQIGVRPVKLRVASPAEIHALLIKVVYSPEKGRSVALFSITERSAAESSLYILYIGVSKYKPALIFVALFYPTSRKLITVLQVGSTHKRPRQDMQGLM
ncbi:uncharacterized protein METZ01_LOCUS311845 [marine metagenome]|uniref:Uncharacterized protein n=1 Tax=marine metagenome TaxID=408172 RepID=A0A382NHD0_9ZZZZ